MVGAAGGAVGYLGAATEAVGQYGGCFGQRSYGGEEDTLADRLRDVVVVSFETEVAGQAATAGVRDVASMPAADISRRSASKPRTAC